MERGCLVVWGGGAGMRGRLIARSIAYRLSPIAYALTPYASSPHTAPKLQQFAAVPGVRAWWRVYSPLACAGGGARRGPLGERGGGRVTARWRLGVGMVAVVLLVAGLVPG